MTKAIFPPSPPVLLPIVNSQDLFPVHRVYAVGRNYAAHAREMGFDPDREPPFYFGKPADTLVPVASGETLDIAYPNLTNNFHYEAELVIAIGKSGKDIPVDKALDFVWGYAVGLDMTRRDLQMKMREMGRPWEIGKAFDASAPIGPLWPAPDAGNVSRARIWLTVNGKTHQDSNVSKLIWSVSELVADLSRYFELRPGDIIYTGTPEGVGPVVPGDVMEVGIDGLGVLKAKVTGTGATS